MAFERYAANKLDQWDKKAQEVMTKNAKSAIITSSVIGAIVFAIPLWGFETAIYFFVLWNMYKTIAKELNKKFGFNAVVKGMIINIAICLIVNLLADFIVVFGWIAAAVIGYFATYQSGVSYMGLLADKN